MIRYLFSSIDCLNRLENDLGDLLKKDIQPNKVVFIPSTPADRLTTEKYVKEILRSFQLVGIEFQNAVTLHSHLETEIMKQEIESADLVFLMGGDTLQQYDFIKDNDLHTVMEQFQGVVMGLSAGAINICKTAVLTNFHEADQNYIYPGLNLVDFSVEVHFEKENGAQEKNVLEISKNVECMYCISDQSVIRVDHENRVSFFGDGIYKVANHRLIRC